MNEQQTMSTRLISTMQDALTVSKEHLSQSVNDINICLVTTPVEQVRAQAHFLTDMAEQLLIDAMQAEMDTLPDDVKQGCQQLFDDWSNLKTPVLPLPVLGPDSRKILELINEVQSVEMYLSIRKELWKKFQILDEVQQEALSGFLAKKLAELMIFEALPYLLSPPKSPVLLRQFHLYSQLTCCRRHGFEDLAPYFLKENKNLVEVLMPPTMPLHDTVDSYYACARNFAILYYQIPACQREIFRDRLKSKVEDEVLYRYALEQVQPGTDALAALYLAFLTAEQDGGFDYWDVECYKKYADNPEGTLNV